MSAGNKLINGSTYDIEEERQRVHAEIWRKGTDNCGTDFLEYYRQLNLELEYRDQQQPRATLHDINDTKE